LTIEETNYEPACESLSSQTYKVYEQALVIDFSDLFSDLNTGDTHTFTFVELDGKVITGLVDFVDGVFEVYSNDNTEIFDSGSLISYRFRMTVWDNNSVSSYLGTLSCLIDFSLNFVPTNQAP